MRIREAAVSDAAAIARVHVDTRRTTYVDILAEDFLENLSYDQRQRMWPEALSAEPRTSHIIVMEDETGSVAGFYDFGAEREGSGNYEGEIYAIYLLAEHQGKGWGKQLFRQAAERLVEAGIPSMMLWVLADNPTRGFYEVMGGTAYDQKEIGVGARPYVEAAYGWDRLPAWISAWDESNP